MRAPGWLATAQETAAGPSRPPSCSTLAEVSVTTLMVTSLAFDNDGCQTGGVGTYRGVAMEDRRADRRRRLLEAGVRVIGESGWQSTTVRAVCSEAGLTERYFYESFADRETLLLDVFDRVSTDAARAILAAVAA